MLHEIQTAMPPFGERESELWLAGFFIEKEAGHTFLSMSCGWTDQGIWCE